MTMIACMSTAAAKTRLENALAHANKCSRTATSNAGKLLWMGIAADFAARLAALG